MGRGFLGFRRNLGEILPTSLPELPIRLRDLRNNQKSFKTYILQNKYQKHLLPLFEGVWAVHTTVIIAADRREARSELGTALCVTQAGAVDFAHLLRFPTAPTAAACACWLSQYGRMMPCSRSGGATLGR